MKRWAYTIDGEVDLDHGWSTGVIVQNTFDEVKLDLDKAGLFLYNIIASCDLSVCSQSRDVAERFFSVILLKCNLLTSVIAKLKSIFNQFSAIYKSFINFCSTHNVLFY